MKQYNTGFSLVELLVTLGIISIIAIIGAPSFQGAVRGSRLTTAINEFSNALSVARSEAIKNNRSVSICKSDTGLVCKNTDANVKWESGWIIFIDTDADGTLDGAGDAAACVANNDCILKIHEALPAGYTLRPNNPAFTNFVRYRPSGVINVAVGGSFYLCDTISSSTPANGTAKAIILNGVGRPRMAIDSDHNGIPEVPVTVSGTTTTVDMPTCTP